MTTKHTYLFSKQILRNNSNKKDYCKRSLILDNLLFLTHQTNIHHLSNAIKETHNIRGICLEGFGHEVKRFKIVIITDDTIRIF